MSDEWRDAVDQFLVALEQQTTDLYRAFEQLADRVARVELHDEVRTMTDWIEHAELAAEPLVSVIVPTRNRADLVGRSLESLRRQHYPNWEAIVVDDGSLDDTPARVAAFGDDRIRYVRTDQGSAGGARNLGLDHVAGEIVAFLDDDNRMHPLWLKAVVWALAQRPDIDVVYGAVVIDDTARHHGEAGFRLPSMWMRRFDRETVATDNIADMSAIAHRATASARFDETLRHGSDWDYLLKLVTDNDPLALPVVALHYFTDAPDRESNKPARDAEYALIRERHRGVAGA